MTRRISCHRAALSGAAVLMGVATMVSASPASAHSAHPVSISAVLGQLAAPRGIAFDNQGNMYVSESGVAKQGPLA
jgi:hypothetical protein